MTKKGYKQILVPTELHQILKLKANEEDCSISKFIKSLLGEGYRYSIDTKQENSLKTLINPVQKDAQNKPYFSNDSSVNASSQEGLRRARRELNP